MRRMLLVACSRARIMGSRKYPVTDVRNIGILVWGFRVLERRRCWGDYFLWMAVWIMTSCRRILIIGINIYFNKAALSPFFASVLCSRITLLTIPPNLRFVQQPPSSETWSTRNRQHTLPPLPPFPPSFSLIAYSLKRLHQRIPQHPLLKLLLPQMTRMRPRLQLHLLPNRIRETLRPLHARVCIRDIHYRLWVYEFCVLAYVVCGCC
jgi:hypothetical protein